MKTDPIPCPFIYANGKQCTGVVTRVEAYKADLAWQRQEDGTWRLEWGEPRSHFHLFCSEKGNHAGYARQDNEQMKRHARRLPPDLWQAMIAAR